MYREAQQQLSHALKQFLTERFGVSDANIVLEQPPKIELGEFATPLAFELAKRLRKAPRQIAQEIGENLTLPAGFEKPEVAGAGYLNFRLAREQAAKAVLKSLASPAARAVFAAGGVE